MNLGQFPHLASSCKCTWCCCIIGELAIVLDGVVSCGSVVIGGRFGVLASCIDSGVVTNALLNFEWQAWILTTTTTISKADSFLIAIFYIIASFYIMTVLIMIVLIVFIIVPALLIKPLHHHLFLVIYFHQFPLILSHQKPIHPHHYHSSKDYEQTNSSAHVHY